MKKPLTIALAITGGIVLIALIFGAGRMAGRATLGISGMRSFNNPRSQAPWTSMGGFGGFGLIGMIVNLVIMLGVIVGVVLLVVWVVRRTSGNTIQSGPQNSTGPSAKEVLQMRYAKGEINRDDYLLMLKDIQ
jgi:putative membrane protein